MFDRAKIYCEKKSFFFESSVKDRQTVSKLERPHIVQRLSNLRSQLQSVQTSFFYKLNRSQGSIPASNGLVGVARRSTTWNYTSLR